MSSSQKGRSFPLILGALGVVFGDIGTSPLYTMQECVHALHNSMGNQASLHDSLYGIISLIFWALTMMVTLKYVTFLMRADNRGEGGIMALLALLPDSQKMKGPGKLAFASILVIAGASLLFGDGIITPAISVLSAMEGLKVLSPQLETFILPSTIVILILLFLVQRRGTQALGNLFGPVMLVWFVALGLLGLIEVVKHPAIFGAISPHYAVNFFIEHRFEGFKILGSVVLAVTGGEALYADMGHFGRSPIRIAWLALVFPCLLLNYMGQASFLLENPTLTENTFYNLVPQILALPMLILATLATTIASQALISGAFSLSHQAIQLGFMPRATVHHTSDEQEGRIYVPSINAIMAILCVALVLIFQKSTALAAAYGLAVTGTMLITSVVFCLVGIHRWNWNRPLAYGLLAVFLAFDVPFFLANCLKFFHGGWVPVFIGAFFFLVMMIWRQGRSLLARHFLTHSPPLDDFLEHLDKQIVSRIPGVGVFMTSNSKGVPPVLSRMVQRFRVVHQSVVLLTVNLENVPYVSANANGIVRFETANIGHDFYRVIVHYGYMESPNVPSILESALESLGISIHPREVVFVLGHETFVDANPGNFTGARHAIFSFLSKTARNATDYFKIPPEQVVELGAHIDL